MNRALFLHTWRANWLRLLIVMIALAAWGSVLPIIYNAFGAQFRQPMESGAIPRQLAEFGGGDIFTLSTRRYKLHGLVLWVSDVQEGATVASPES